MKVPRVFRYTVLVMLVILSNVFADSEMQTDWSGGPGQSDPVSEWTSSFYASVGANWLYSPGGVSIAAEFIDPVQYEISIELELIVGLISCDMDTDGDIDLVVSSCNSFNTPDSVVWMENLAQGSLNWPVHKITLKQPPIRSIEVCDMDGDGNIDLVGNAFGNGTNIYWFEGDGTGLSWIEHSVTENQNYSTVIHLVDMDIDGDMDVVSGTYYVEQNGMSWWENIDGAGETWSEHVINSGYSGAVTIDHFDADCDGDIDIAVNAHFINHTISWWENLDGAGTEWSGHELATACYDNGLAAIDIDRDNDQDLLVSGSSGNRIGFWRNIDGSGNFEYFNIASCDANEVCGADMDLDGDVDVAAALFNDHGVRHWENLSEIAVNVWHEREIGDLNHAHTIEAVDIDGDSLVELVSGSKWAPEHPEIRYWHFIEPGSSGWLESSILHVDDCEPEWSTIEWEGQQPGGSSISMRVRSSDDPLSMGDWSDTMPLPGNLPESVADGDNYFQYRVCLETGTNPGIQPVLESVTVSWNPSGISDTGESTVLLPFNPNPCASNPVIRFSLSSPSMIEFNLFDVSGRLAVEIPARDYQAGIYNVELNGILPAGVYHCRMSAGEYSSTQRLVVVR